MNERRLATREQDTEEYWISISDMMAGLMVVFLFIAISYMLNIRADKEMIEEIVVTYEKLKESLYNDLYEEFKDDLDKWNAELERETLTMRFREPDVLFEQGSAEIRPRFRHILNDFFPRYIERLTVTETHDGKSRYKEDIEEIRIEGHTSKEWSVEATPREAYILNMELSQRRTRSVLAYVLYIDKPHIQENREWIMTNVTANGLSSSKLIKRSDSTEDRRKSRRVEFRVRTNAERQMVKILKRKEAK